MNYEKECPGCPSPMRCHRSGCEMAGGPVFPLKCKEPHCADGMVPALPDGHPEPCPQCHGFGEGYPTTVVRAGWVIESVNEPMNYWSADLDGLVSSHENATFYPTKIAANIVIDRRNLGRWFSAKRKVELTI